MAEIPIWQSLVLLHCQTCLDVLRSFPTIMILWIYSTNCLQPALNTWINILRWAGLSKLYVLSVETINHFWKPIFTVCLDFIRWVFYRHTDVCEVITYQRPHSFSFVTTSAFWRWSSSYVKQTWLNCQCRAPKSLKYLTASVGWWRARSHICLLDNNIWMLCKQSLHHITPTALCKNKLFTYIPKTKKGI